MEPNWSISSRANAKTASRFRDRKIAAGELLIIPPELEHRQIDLGFVRTFYVVFEAKPGVFRNDLRSIDVRSDRFVRSWMEQLVLLYQEQALDQCRLLLPALLARITRLEGSIDGTAEIPAGLAAAIRFITYHFHRELAIREIAASNGMSPELLQRAVPQAHAGQSGGIHQKTAHGPRPSTAPQQPPDHL